MHGGHAAGAQVGGGPHRLLRVHVHVLEEPVRLVRADRQQRQVDARVPLGDPGEPAAVAGVAGEVHPVGGGCGQHPAAPQRPAAVGQTAAAPVVRRHEVEPHLTAARRGQRRRLPPVQLHDAAEPAAGEPRAEPGRHEHRGGARQPADRGRVEVVVVVVRDHHGVDAVQRAERHARWRPARPDAGDAPGPHRVGQHGQPADPQHERGVPHPRGRRRAVIRRGCVPDGDVGNTGQVAGTHAAGQPQHLLRLRRRDR